MNCIHLTGFSINNISIKKLPFLILQTIGLLACCFFLFSDAKMIYLSFNGNGNKGFWLGFVNVLAVHIVFLTVFHFSLCASLKPQPLVLSVGSLLSCNAANYATVRQSLFDQKTIALQPFLYLLPLISTFLFLLLTKKPKRHCIKPFFIQNRYLVFGTVYVLILPFFPLNQYFQYMNQGNVVFIGLLAVCQAYRNQKQKSQKIDAS